MVLWFGAGFRRRASCRGLTLRRRNADWLSPDPPSQIGCVSLA
jgi:hypothetical protein